jgi:hypothetical protein
MFSYNAHYPTYNAHYPTGFRKKCRGKFSNASPRKEWYSKAIASAFPLFRDDENGGFYVISGLSKRGGESIDTLLAGQMGCIQQSMVACSEAGRIVREWRNIATR